VADEHVPTRTTLHYDGEGNEVPGQPGDLVVWLRAQIDVDERYADEYPPFQARVLREVEAKRRLIGMYEASAKAAADDPNDDEQVHCARGLRYAVEVAALPYSDRPGYLDKWRP
jgi:hypothetical protein